LCVCFLVLVAPSRPEGRRMIDSSGRGNPRRVRLAHGVWHDQPLGTTSNPPCHGVNNTADMPWFGVGRGPREGCARGWRRYWACTAGHSLARASAIDTYFEQAALMGTILAGRIVTTTIVQNVTCDTISFIVEEATGRKYVRALPVRAGAPRPPEGLRHAPGRGEGGSGRGSRRWSGGRASCWTASRRFWSRPRLGRAGGGSLRPWGP